MHPHRHNHHTDDAEGQPGPGRRFRSGPPWSRGFGPDTFGPGLRRGRRSRRGDVRAAVLVLLEEGPRNGYQLIQELAERSMGAWRPSPGSVYPILSQLEDEGLIAPVVDAEGRGFALTDRGREEVSTNRERFGRPWEAAASSFSEPRRQLVLTFRQLAAAFRQLWETGTDAQVDAATALLADARRAIYRLLADEPGPDAGDS